MDGALMYDPVRLRALAQHTRSAIQWLDGRTSDEPMADRAITSLRRISHSLATTWLPYFARLLGDASMTTWDAMGPAGGVTTPATFRGADGPEAPVDDAEVAAAVELAERAAAGDTVAVQALGDVVVEHTGDSAFLSGLAVALGPDGVAAVVLAVGANPSIRPGVSSPAMLGAQHAVIEALVPYRSGALTDPAYTLEGHLDAGPPAALAPELNPGCIDLGDAAPGGGGIVVGPDGRRYPIVVEDEPPGAGDWEVVCYQSGVERFQAAPSNIERVAAVWAGSTGLVRAPPPNEALYFVVMAPGALPHLSAAPWTPAPIDRIRSVGTPDPADSSAAAVIPGSLGIVITAGQGVSFAAGLDNQRERAYQVVFEQDSLGRRRARVETYTLTYDELGDLVIVPENVFVDPEGTLMSQEIRYPPGAAPSGADVWPAAFDQEREIVTQPIAGATLP